MYWPEPLIDLDGGVLLWNYAVVDQAAPPEELLERFDIGYAVLEPELACPGD